MTTALLVLVPLSLIFLGVAVWVFFWAADDGQFDDLETPAWKIVLDDDSKPPADDE